MSIAARCTCDRKGSGFGKDDGYCPRHSPRRSITTRLGAACQLCKGTGVADLSDPWGGVRGTCPDCHGNRASNPPGDLDGSPHLGRYATADDGVTVTESPAYWLCCGSQDPAHRDRSCLEAQSGHPERCRFGTVAEHSQWQRGAQDDAVITEAVLFDLLKQVHMHMRRDEKAKFNTGPGDALWCKFNGWEVTPHLQAALDKFERGER